MQWEKMPDRSRKRPTDPNELAAQIVGEATGEVDPPTRTLATTLPASL
jgi:hypothetical protein